MKVKAEIEFIEVEQRGVHLEVEYALIELLVSFYLGEGQLKRNSHVCAGRRSSLSAVLAPVADLNRTDG